MLGKNGEGTKQTNKQTPTHRHRQKPGDFRGTVGWGRVEEDKGQAKVMNRDLGW